MTISGEQKKPSNEPEKNRKLKEAFFELRDKNIAQGATGDVRI